MAETFCVRFILGILFELDFISVTPGEVFWALE